MAHKLSEETLSSPAPLPMNFKGWASKGLSCSLPPGKDSTAKASIAAGADGIIVEIHPKPDQALTDAQQTIGPEAFSQMMKEIHTIHQALKAL
jgi:hypothetical protein